MRLRWRVVLGVMSVYGCLLTLGCGDKKDGGVDLNTQAPPPSNPNAVPEQAVNKRRPPAPPMAGAPQGK
ncbi:MAG: hypothetical protein V4671_27655 [Armatimonadota bacterium]